jgi:DNA-binding transcriptional MerR regulator
VPVTAAASLSRFRIGDLARLAGPGVSTLRAWQERYPGLLRPARTAGGHRLYDATDLAAVQAMQQLVAAGHTVAAAAAHVIEQRKRGRPPLEGVAGAEPPAHGAATAERTQTWWAQTATEELDALRAVHRATRAVLRATTPGEVAAAVAQLVDDVGGTVHPARAGGETALPLDLSLGTGTPMLAHAPVGSPARRRLEALLPILVEDARLAAGRLRVQRDRSGESGSRSRARG